MKNIAKAIQHETSEKRLYNTVKEVSNFHRIQCSPGIRAACEWTCRKLQDQGFEARILSFDANPDTWYLSQKMFKEWDCREAYLNIVNWDNEKIADYGEEPLSLIQRSYPCDYRNEPLDIVLVERLDDEYLQTLDLKGKLALISAMPRWMSNDIMTKYGAVGLIDDLVMEVEGVRQRNDLYDTLNYTSFWWRHTADEPQPFGFVLTPRVGDRLRKLCADMEAAWQKDNSLPRYPQATCYVDASLYDGHMEVVEAVLPGKSDEEIIMSAHICHPRACCNDNSSGVAGSMEALRVLKTLQDQGKITLNKTIRLILVPEMTGTYAYLSTIDDHSKIKGGINMDMIGARQDRSYGPITITGTHHAINSPVTSVAAYALNYAKQMVFNLEGDEVSTVNTYISPYSGGSDHIIFSEPTIGIPTIMLGQWPDKYYHTSSDTMEVIDTNVLKFSTTFAAMYVYALSNFDESMKEDFLMEHMHLMIDDLKRVNGSSKARAQHVVDYYTCVLDNMAVYGASFSEEEKKSVHDAGMAMMNMLKLNDEEVHYEGDEVPFKKIVGPADSLDDHVTRHPDKQAALDEYKKMDKSTGFHIRSYEEYAWNYIDGKRTIGQICEAIWLETGDCDEEMVKAYLKACHELELIGWKN